MTENQQDRISYGVSRAVKDYGDGFDVHISYSSDVQGNETPEEALKRVALFVEKELNKKILRMTKKYGK